MEGHKDIHIAMGADTKSICDISTRQPNHAHGGEVVHRSSFDDHSDDADDDHSLGKMPYSPATRQDMHDAELISTGVWPRDFSYSVSRKSPFSAPEMVSLQSTEYYIKPANETSRYGSTSTARPSGSPRRPISALPRVPRSRSHQRRIPLITPPSTPPGPVADPSSMFLYPAVDLGPPSAGSTMSIAPPPRDSDDWDEKQLSWRTIMAMMAAQQPSAGIAIAEAQASAIQAIIQANYDTFLSSKRSESRLRGGWKAEGAQNLCHDPEGDGNGEKNDASDEHSACSEKSEREAFERIFLSEGSMSSVGGQENAGCEVEVGTAKSSNGSSRTSSDGTGVAVSRACGAGVEKGGSTEWVSQLDERAF
jgi:hypothetical protein